MEELKKLDIWTDGACRGNPGLGAWAFQYTSVSNLLEEHSGIATETTNNCMELTAIFQALSKLIMYEIDYIDQVTIHSDSQYSIDVITKWSNNWKDQDFNERPNGDLIKNIRTLRSQLYEAGVKVIFHKVKGHAGVDGNESVDRLCNLAMDEYIKNSQSINVCPYCMDENPLAISSIPTGTASITLRRNPGCMSSNYVIDVQIKDYKIGLPGDTIRYCPCCGRKLDN